MPSWPTRLFLGSSAATPSTLLATTNEPLTPLRSPTSHATSGSVPRAASQHGRSFSHPFPSIFGSRKKKTTRDEDDDDGDDDVVDAKTQLGGTPTFSAADPLGHSHTVSACTIISPLPLIFSRANWSYKQALRRSRYAYSSAQVRRRSEWLISIFLTGHYFP